MKDEPCRFCEELALWKRLQRQNRKEGSPIRNVYGAALVIKSKKDGVRGTRGRITSKSYPLAYCPVCGRRVKQQRKGEKACADAERALSGELEQDSAGKERGLRMGVRDMRETMPEA